MAAPLVYIVPVFYLVRNVVHKLQHSFNYKLDDVIAVLWPITIKSSVSDKAIF